MKLSKTVDSKTQYINLFLNQEEFGVLAHFMREALTRMLGFEESNPCSGTNQK
jgi:hypothetical protein